ncbi:HIGH AFFINITY RIBOSE TRANSPORT PROTEIN RBSD [Mycoplasmopsis pulmonis]|uniref:D-ribose pyranase n=1 Tax=Mycoplasmopsis pulmonis (strain UAB CTIP) TaxID=272635 RepID=Q98PW9_MYCPU|nr:RbsD/FucU domain-containing protein [Mycoplasmopsis pulmonis]CAC13773.1 HIGH AFFINITY RIBOSE TRANSPORT PROTEIN RBSD [Mycoplasmopsis pulmonis]VEU68361.1 high affinity ribose transport protein RBSD [Mycoplasmopsis pulmonis]
MYNQDFQIINTTLNETLSRIQTNQKIVVCDPYFPIPVGANILDLSLIANVPSFKQLMFLIIENLHIKALVLSNEIKEHNYDYLAYLISSKLPISLSNNFEEFKYLSSQNDVVLYVRVGELTPFSNTIVVAGKA